MEYSKALNSCMQLCSRNEMCRFDIEEKLKRWELDENEVETIMKTLYDQHFIDDQRFVKAYINDKLKFNHWGKIKIRFMLNARQLRSQLVESAINEIDPELYHDILVEEIKKKLPKIKAKSDYERKGKLASYMASRGFETDLVFKNINLDITE